MKFLKSIPFSLLGLIFINGSFAGNSLPDFDPHPTQAEATFAEVSSRKERLDAPAVPRESYSAFALAGFQTTPSSESESNGGDEGLAFCHGAKWSTACLTGLIVYRCGQYTFPFTPYGCALAAGAFVADLQMKRIDVVVEEKTYSLPVIFTDRLEKLIQNRATQMDIASLRILLAAAKKEKRRFDLWQWSWAMTNGNFGKTLENLAVLLQDTSGVAIQINYLKGIAKKRGFNPATMKAIEDLDEVNYQLNNEILNEGDYRAWLSLYPAKALDQELTPLVYHFYPMAYSALLLKRAGNGNRLSSFIPFLFNTEYLNQTLDPEAWPFKHPKPFKLDSDWKLWKMRDMYGGYAGALWGVQKMRALPGIDLFQKTYAEAPYEAMRRHFWVMPNP